MLEDRAQLGNERRRHIHAESMSELRIRAVLLSGRGDRGMRIIGVDGYNILVLIDKEDYPKWVRAFANLDDDDPKEE